MSLKLHSYQFLRHFWDKTGGPRGEMLTLSKPSTLTGPREERPRGNPRSSPPTPPTGEASGTLPHQVTYSTGWAGPTLTPEPPWRWPRHGAGTTRQITNGWSGTAKCLGSSEPHCPGSDCGAKGSRPGKRDSAFTCLTPGFHLGFCAKRNNSHGQKRRDVSGQQLNFKSCFNAVSCDGC